MLKRWWLTLGGCALLLSFHVSATKYVPIAVGDITIIIPIDEAPIASPEIITVLEDSTTVLDVLANDSDELMDQVQLYISAPSDLSQLNGTLVQNGNQLTYSPAANEFGQNYDTFSYYLTDVEGNQSEPVSVVLHVTGVNDPPISSQGDSWTYYMNEDAAGSFWGLYSFSDVENEPLEVVNVTANFTAVEVNDNGTDIKYRTKANYHGFDTMRVYVSDGTDITRLDWNLVIRPKPDLPIISPILKHNGDSLEVRVEIVDPEAQPLSVKFDVDPESQGATNFQWQYLSPSSSSGNTYVYTKTYSGMTNGDYSFEVTVVDNEDIPMDVVVVPFKIDAVNDAPTANDDTYDELEAGKATTLLVTSNDGDIDSTNFTIHTITDAPDNGNVVISSDKKSIVYTASSTFFGKDTLKYTLIDAQGAISQEASVSLYVEPVEAPVKTFILDFRTTSSQEILPNTSVNFTWSRPDDLPDNYEYRVANIHSSNYSATTSESISISFPSLGSYTYAVKVCIQNTSDCSIASNLLTINVVSLSISGLTASPTRAVQYTPVTISWNPVYVSNVYYVVEADRPGSNGYVWDVLEPEYYLSERTRSPGQLGVYTYRITACSAELDCGEPSTVEVEMLEVVNNDKALTYEYDDFGRLWRVRQNSTIIIEYTYDNAGNRESVSYRKGS